jgi:hypothetical protein
MILLIIYNIICHDWLIIFIIDCFYWLMNFTIDCCDCWIVFVWVNNQVVDLDPDSMTSVDLDPYLES